MNTAKAKGILILITFSLIVSIFASVGMTGDVQASGTTYVKHATIQVIGNDDLAYYKSKGVCTGTGTVVIPM